MQTQEAIEWIKAISAVQKDSIHKSSYLQRKEALHMAIQALRKQIPKKLTDLSKVRDHEGYVGLIGKCPCCGEILEEDTVYCDCGQKLDWSE